MNCNKSCKLCPVKSENVNGRWLDVADDKDPSRKVQPCTELLCITCYNEKITTCKHENRMLVRKPNPEHIFSSSTVEMCRKCLSGFLISLHAEEIQQF
jgi:hypothetical protein